VEFRAAEEDVVVEGDAVEVGLLIENGLHKGDGMLEVREEVGFAVEMRGVEAGRAEELCAEERGVGLEGRFREVDGLLELNGSEVGFSGEDGPGEDAGGGKNVARVVGRGEDEAGEIGCGVLLGSGLQD
jgi:hypothetical protein